MVTPIGTDEDQAGIPFVTLGLIVTNLVVFGFEFNLTATELQRVFQEWGSRPIYLHYGNVSKFLLTVFASMFLHAGIGHLLGNLLFLWVFGGTIEARFGHLNFIVLYLVSGFFGAFVTFVIYPASTVPSIGASGAVAGVLACFIMLASLANIRVIMMLGPIPFTFNIPAWLIIGLWIGLNYLNGYLTSGGYQTGGTGWFAHIGGFVGGFLVVFIHQLLRLYDYDSRRVETSV